MHSASASVYWLKKLHLLVRMLAPGGLRLVVTRIKEPLKPGDNFQAKGDKGHSGHQH